MPSPLPVHVNREELHDLAVPESYETTGSFEIRLVNHGEPSHVHLHLDDPLSTAAAIEATNHYVEGDSERRVTVQVREGATIQGSLKVSVGYGATTRYVDVVLTEPPESEQPVAVDESLARPQPTEPESTGLLDQGPIVPILALGALAVVVAIGTALVVQDLVVAVGAAAVFLGVAVAVTVLLIE